jgi:asparagine synthase (glutamine-hydrolysing)
VINGQRNYEFLGLDWSLPLWDSALVAFWRNIPVEQKFRQKLFAQALARWDYRGLFRDFNPKVDQWSGAARAVLIPSRLIRLSRGAARRDAFLRRMLYFGMYRDQYAPFGYATFLREAGDLRNPVSLLSRAWLEELGLSAERA